METEEGSTEVIKRDQDGETGEVKDVRITDGEGNQIVVNGNPDNNTDGGATDIGTIRPGEFGESLKELDSLIFESLKQLAEEKSDSLKTQENLWQEAKMNYKRSIESAGFMSSFFTGEGDELLFLGFAKELVLIDHDAVSYTHLTLPTTSRV